MGTVDCVDTLDSPFNVHPKTVVLKGEAGVGKSHLALYFVHLHDDGNEFSGVM
jgi:DNA replication protein DnaC